MPDSVLMPAPVNTTARRASGIRRASAAISLSRVMPLLWQTAIPPPSPSAEASTRLCQKPGEAHDPLAGFSEARLGGAQRDPQVTCGARAEPVARQHRDPFGIEQPGGECCSVEAG